MTVSWVPKTIAGVGNLLEYPQGSEVIVLRIMKAWVIGVKALPVEPLSSFLTKDFDFYKI